MNEAPWHDLLQRHLDGELGRDEVAPHVPPGGDRQAVERLLAGVALLTPASAPHELPRRITAALCKAANQRRRRRLWRRLAPLGGLAAAAGLLLALGLGLSWPLPGPVAPPRPDVAAAEAPAEPLRDSVNRAGTALARMTSQTAETTVESTTLIVPNVMGQSMPAMPSIEPPLEPLLEASAGVSGGLAPVANSARRAVELFLRDLPVGRAPAHKPG